MAVVNRKPGIYCIIIKGNSKKYIGSSINLQVRENAHINLLRKNKHFNKPLQFSFNKYGENNYKFEIIEFTKENETITKEQYYIDYYNIDNLYNIFSIAGDTSKMIQSKKEKKFTEEHKKKISLSLMGRECSKKTRLKLRKSHLGKKLSKNHKDKLSKSHTGKVLKSEHKQNISNALIGTKRNDNTSGCTGVYYHKQNKKYVVKIKNKSYGCYFNKEDAILKAKSVYNSILEGV